MEENKWKKEVHSHVWPHKNKQILCFSPFHPHVQMCSRVNLWGMKAFPISHICTSSAQLYIWHLYFLSIQIQSNPTSALKNCFCSSRTISSCCEEICNNEYFSLSSYNIRSHISLYDSIKIKSKWIYLFFSTERVIRVMEGNMCLYLKHKVHLATKLCISHHFSKEPDSCF